MTIRPIILCGAASAALLGCILFAAPVLAQSDTNPPQYSSPAARAETQQLNEQNLNGTTQSPAVLNGEAQPAPYPPNGNEGDDSAAPEAQQQGQYDDQMQQYQDQQDQYQQQRDQYDRQVQRYDQNLRQYDQAQWAYDYPPAYSYDYDGDHLVRIDRIATPTDQLYQVPVEGPNGVWVGKIRNVETAPDGAPARVEVSLNRRVSVWVDPRDLRFDPDQRVAYTDLTRDDLWQLPGATVENAPM